MIKDYLSDRWLVYDTNDGPRYKRITAGAAQGSILGPDLWNVSYDGLLRTEMPEDTFLIGYADDVAAIVTARSPELAQLKLNQVMRKVNRWMDAHGLELAISKTEIVMLSRRRIPKIIPMMVGSMEIRTSETAKYLGITFDTKFTFWPHISKACDKAETVTASLSRLMANVGGPRPFTRKLLMSTVNSILLYGAEVWAKVMKIKKYSKRMTSVQRKGALRIACSYRTVSEAAVLVVAGVIPIDLLAQERRDIFQQSQLMGRTEASVQARAQTMELWQQRWSGSSVGRWTARLIKNLAPWVERAHGEVNFYVTQFLTGHGYFRAYLCKRGKVRTPQCTYCGADKDDAAHTFFVCEEFAAERRALMTAIGEITPDNVVEIMLRGQDDWIAVSKYVELALRRKNNDGCLVD